MGRSAFPELPIWRLKKVMENHPRMNYEQLCKLIKERRPKWEHEKQQQCFDKKDYSGEKKECIELFEKLRSAFPELPIWRLKKVMQNHPKMDFEKLCKLIKERISKWQEQNKLDEGEQQKIKEEWTEKMISNFTQLREIFPKFPVDIMKKVIANNKDASIEFLANRIANKIAAMRSGK